VPHMTTDDTSNAITRERGSGFPMSFVQNLPATYLLGDAVAIFPASYRASPTTRGDIRLRTCHRTGSAFAKTAPAMEFGPLLDALKIDKAHIVGIAMGVSALHSA